MRPRRRRGGLRGAPPSSAAHLPAICDALITKQIAAMKATQDHHLHQRRHAAEDVALARAAARTSAATARSWARSAATAWRARRGSPPRASGRPGAVGSGLGAGLVGRVQGARRQLDRPDQLRRHLRHRIDLERLEHRVEPPDLVQQLQAAARSRSCGRTTASGGSRTPVRASPRPRRRCRAPLPTPWPSVPLVVVPAGVCPGAARRDIP